MKLSIVAGATSQSVNIFVRDSSSTTGAGLTGLVFNTASLVAYCTFAGANATATSITLATLAAVNSVFSSGGFKEIDATNMPGWYRFDIPNAALVTSKGRSVAIHFKGATNMAPLPLEIELTGWDNQDAVRGGMTAFPNVASGSAGALLVDGTGTAAISNSSGKVLLQATQTGVTIPTVTTVTNQLTAAAIATGIWQDATAGDFTTASSIGKSLYTSGNVPGAASGLAVVGSNMGTVTSVTGSVGSVTGAVGSVTGAVGSVTGNVGGNVVGSVASVTARVTANADQLAGQTVTAAAGVTFPTSVASPTNITAGTIATVTNLTNAPTAGDFTATMKTSLNAATPASVAGAVGSVTGSVGSVVSAVTTTDHSTIATNLDTTISSRAATGAQMDLVNAPNATAITAFANGLLDLASAIDSGSIDTVREAFRIMLASAAGKLSGAATTSITIRDTGDLKNRIVATVDSDGNRTALTYDAS